MIQVLILQLDTNFADFTNLIQICIELQLYRAMMFLCNKSGDYLTPLMKLMALFEKKHEEELKSNSIIQR